MTGASLRARLPFHLKRETVNLTLLLAMAGTLFVLVASLSSVFHAQQDALADRWSSRGDADLKAAHYEAAADDYRAALRYSHDDYSYQLGLAEALLGLKRTSEASAYLVNLWDEQPENGVVNLELARIAAGRGETQQALRYYHNAIYATWGEQAERHRLDTRWELIRYLLTLHANALAQSELISLAAEVGDEPLQQTLLGQYFLKVGDEQHALSAFRLRLAVNPHNSEALAGAGTAAASLGNYELALHYLRRAVEEVPGDAQVAATLQMVQAVARLNPARQSSDAERTRALIEDFNAAGTRLQSCSALTAGQPNYVATWQELKPGVTATGLRRNPDLGDRALNLVFAIERQAANQCGPGSPTDRALLEIAKSHEGS